MERSIINSSEHPNTHAGHALQMLADFSVATPSGTIQGKAGDYILKDNKGFVSVLKNNSFRRQYRIVRQ
ncbi:hypothetical protein J2755_000505 [Methanohalophilus levihalophilus]|uniref:hypothetical protein n=1 Tax=Methanohalophilus levihalophilus TaxID=1431282 RepID=UPI001AEA4338|nr:hypothetical protein [Methanohalophilus levihalophilus]MBP2029585.1 hypothetical protein [Methanohalophilus levihalophilus]